MIYNSKKYMMNKNVFSLVIILLLSFYFESFSQPAERIQKEL